MIQPVASGKLFQVYSSSVSYDFQSQEQGAIAELERTRRAMLVLQAKIQQTRADSERFGESQGDVGQLQGQLKSAQKEYNSARSALADLRSQKRTDASTTEQRQPYSANAYLEKRSFARTFPDDAQAIRSYQIYDKKGEKTVFSSSYLQFVGTAIDVRV